MPENPDFVWLYVRSSGLMVGNVEWFDFQGLEDAVRKIDAAANGGTQRCGRSAAREMATDAARPHSLK
jgi:hypothetical protein